MLIAFVIIIIITGLAILFSVYSIFSPFLNNFGDIVNYNTAYYGAISAVERAELVLKYRSPGFQGSGGRLDLNNFGMPSDLLLTGNVILFEENNGILWNIDSRTQRIPNAGFGNVETDLRGTGSQDYNKIDYKTVETFILGIDESSLEYYYTGGGSYRNYYTGLYITGQFRLPPKIFASFSGSFLCDSNQFLEMCDPDKDNLADDIIVDWSLRGYYSGEQFFIMPSESVSYFGDEKEVQSDDTAIRESNANTGSSIIFRSSKNIFDSGATSPEFQNFVSINSFISGATFQDIFTSTDYTGLQLKFAIVNFLNSFNGNLYPFLEYFFDFGSPISDRFYTIQGEGRKGNYDVKIIIKKPTFKDTVAGSFTVIF